LKGEKCENCQIKYSNVEANVAYELYKTTVTTREDIIKYNPEYVIFSNYYKPGALEQSNIAKDYLKKKYVCIKKIKPDTYINFFPCFDSLFFNTFETINKVNIRSRNMPFSYGPVIEIYKNKLKGSKEE